MKLCNGHIEGDAMIFVFEVNVRPGYSAAAYAEAWVRASRIIQRAPGARGTRLHRKIGEPNKLLAIASWESKSARDQMEREPMAAVQQIIRQQAEYVDITVVGEFEDPEWVVAS
jgi:heme-degrading monooxygenase HmoA